MNFSFTIHILINEFYLKHNGHFYLENIIKLVSDSAIEELEIEERKQNTHIKNPKRLLLPFRFHNSFTPQQLPPSASPQSESAAPAVAQPKSNGKEVRSPIVGTFYRTPAPDAHRMWKSEVPLKWYCVCIVEAMKPANEIESEIEGKIVKILVENGKPVEFNQPLFLVEPLM